MCRWRLPIRPQQWTLLRDVHGEQRSVELPGIAFVPMGLVQEVHERLRATVQQRGLQQGCWLRMEQDVQYVLRGLLWNVVVDSVPAEPELFVDRSQLRPNMRPGLHLRRVVRSSFAMHVGR
jgi:hypothetical protein